MKRICIFCGANAGNVPRFAEAARALAAALAARGLGAVTGGGHVGLMGVVADAMLERGAEVVGVIPQALSELEVGHRGLTELHVVQSMHERKQLMHDLSVGFVALPGGMGTLDELFETLTWSQLGFNGKPVGVLNVDGYYDPLLAMLDRAVSSGLLHEENRDLLLVGTEADALLDRFATWEPRYRAKWIDRDET